MQGPSPGPLTLPAAEDFRHGRVHAPELDARWRPAAQPSAVVAMIQGIGEHPGHYEHVLAALGARGDSYLTVDDDRGDTGEALSHDSAVDEAEKGQVLSDLLDQLDRHLPQA